MKCENGREAVVRFTRNHPDPTRRWSLRLCSYCSKDTGDRFFDVGGTHFTKSGRSVIIGDKK